MTDLDINQNELYSSEESRRFKIQQDSIESTESLVRSSLSVSQELCRAQVQSASDQLSLVCYVCELSAIDPPIWAHARSIAQDWKEATPPATTFHQFANATDSIFKTPFDRVQIALLLEFHDQIKQSGSTCLAAFDLLFSLYREFRYRLAQQSVPGSSRSSQRGGSQRGVQGREKKRLVRPSLSSDCPRRQNLGGESLHHAVAVITSPA